MVESCCANVKLKAEISYAKSQLLLAKVKNFSPL